LSSKSLYVFIGPPGSGKGSLSNLCVRDFGWIQLSTGNLCRKNIANQTEIGKQIDFALKSGKLVSDSLITEMVVQWLEKKADKYESIILDGYPRTVAQAQELYALLKDRLKDFKLKVVRLRIRDGHIITRLTSRYVCENRDCQAIYSSAVASSVPKVANVCDHCGDKVGRRDDDNKETIENRLKTYHQYEQPLLDYFASEGCNIKECNVEKSLDDVFKEFKNVAGLDSV